MSTYTYTDTEKSFVYDHLFGAGASSFPWWYDSSAYEDDGNTVWPVTVVSCDPDDTRLDHETHTVTFEDAINAAWHIFAPDDIQNRYRDDLRGTMGDLLNDPITADVDALDADAWMHVIVFGDIEYS